MRKPTIAAVALALLVGLASFSGDIPDCVGCHASRGITGSAIRDWKMSKHAAGGV